MGEEIQKSRKIEWIFNLNYDEKLVWAVWSKKKGRADDDIVNYWRIKIKIYKLLGWFIFFTIALQSNPLNFLMSMENWRLPNISYDFMIAENETQ